MGSGVEVAPDVTLVSAFAHEPAFTFAETARAYLEDLDRQILVVIGPRAPFAYWATQPPPKIEAAKFGGRRLGPTWKT